MKIAVVDDERPARRELSYLLRMCDPEAEILELEEPGEVLSLIPEERPDICFLDIELEGMNGTTLASMILNQCRDMVVVFATAYQEYAVKAFELGAADYLLKPFDLERVQLALTRARERVQERIRPTAAGGTAFPRMMVLKEGRLQIIDVKDIVFIETEKRGCRLYTLKDRFEQTETLGHYEKRLEGFDFYRIHKSYLINLAYVRELLPYYNNGYAVKMKGYENQPLPVGRQQIKVLRQLFD